MLQKSVQVHICPKSMEFGRFVGGARRFVTLSPMSVDGNHLILRNDILGRCIVQVNVPKTVTNAHLHKINEIWTVNHKEEDFGLFLAVNHKPSKSIHFCP